MLSVAVEGSTFCADGFEDLEEELEEELGDEAVEDDFELEDWVEVLMFESERGGPSFRGVLLEPWEEPGKGASVAYHRMRTRTSCPGGAGGKETAKARPAQEPRAGLAHF